MCFHPFLYSIKYCFLFVYIWSKKVKKILINKNVLYKRLVEAFPNFMNPKERLLLIKARVEKELKKYIKKDKK